MKILLPLLLPLFFFMGCNSKHYYTLGESLNVQSQTTFTKPIDVVSVQVPKYLETPELVRQVTPYRVELLDKAQWLTPMKARLTNVLIEYLQQSMKNPNIHLYPWNANEKAYKRVSLTITRFIANQNHVYLQANYKINNLETHKSETKLFNTTVSTNKSIDTMVSSMEMAYLRLAEKIKSDILTHK